MVHRVGVSYVCPVAPLIYKGLVMKVWVALHTFQFEGADFIGVGETKEAAKKLCGSDRDWQDEGDVRSTAYVNEDETYEVFQETVAT